ncbi:LLM class flavin-dependent oxidoreductase [Mycobacterium ahvazicum]|uniref:LLM class flavin-dependent oxidoreductase n=1 Tax=Mycobacterium ahvazicum TaxID=1964395 RepID=A0A2K4YH05_9MYCO|nr:LLM class flavin-dependent oxidoreductase [Mycobacterium ahvazicum]SOX56071.1 LLM class flavin-dependent oxidoreductase [Mycobacterium ahvazicum]
MTALQLGVLHNTINSRFGPGPLVRADHIMALVTGSDSLWVGDHLNGVLPRSMWTPKHTGLAKIIPNIDAHLEPWTMLGHLASLSRIGRLRLGISVTDPGRRNPAVTAQAAATLHLLTKGRAILGIGTGEREGNEPYGVDWSKPVARFEEALATIRALWDSRGELINRDSPFFPLHNATFNVPPYKGAWPPVWIAANGPRMIRAAGKYADGWFPANITQPKTYGEKLTALRAAASDAGRNPDHITPAAIRFVITGRNWDDINEILDSDIAKIFMLASPAEAWARHGSQHPMGAEFTGVQDLVPQTIDEVTALRYATKVPKSLLQEQFAVGTPDEVVEQFAEWRDQGLRYLVVGNASAIQPSMTKGMATTRPYLKVIRGLKKL